MSTESTAPLSPEGGEPTAETRAFEARAFETRPFESEAGRAPRERLRVGTVVWGLVLALAGVAVLAWGQGVRFDVQLAAIGVLAAAGALLVVSAVTRSKKRA